MQEKSSVSLDISSRRLYFCVNLLKVHFPLSQSKNHWTKQIPMGLTKIHKTYILISRDFNRTLRCAYFNNRTIFLLKSKILEKFFIQKRIAFAKVMEFRSTPSLYIRWCSNMLALLGLWFETMLQSQRAQLRSPYRAAMTIVLQIQVWGKTEVQWKILKVRKKFDHKKKHNGFTSAESTRCLYTFVFVRDAFTNFILYVFAFQTSTQTVPQACHQKGFLITASNS